MIILVDVFIYQSDGMLITQHRVNGKIDMALLVVSAFRAAFGRNI
jgi:hypothetical protein